MASEIKLPKLAEGFKSGDVVDVKVNVGAQVAKNQPLLEIEVEKSTVEVKSPDAGRITKVMVKKGDNVIIGQPLFELEPGAATAARPLPGRPPRKQRPLLRQDRRSRKNSRPRRK